MGKIKLEVQGRFIEWEKGGVFPWTPDTSEALVTRYNAFEKGGCVEEARDILRSEFTGTKGLIEPAKSVIGKLEALMGKENESGA